MLCGDVSKQPSAVWRCLAAAQCGEEMSQSSSVWCGDVSKLPTVEMWATHWVIVSPNDAIPGKRETESLPYLILNTYLQARNGLTDDSFGVIQAVSNIFHLWSGKKRQKGVWTLVRLRFREYARHRPALSDTLYLPPLYLKTQARVHLISYRTQPPIKSSTESRTVLILQILQKT